MLNVKFSTRQIGYMWRYIGLALVGIVIVVFGFSLVEVSGGTDVGASAAISSANVDLDNYAQATDPNYNWQFPQDHGAHEDFLTEWWYYTGNVAAEDGRRFGFQYTVFRRAVLPENQTQDSEWRTRQVYLVHFTVSDIETGTFYHDERFSRGAAGLAGATTDPRYRVWVEDWQVEAQNDDATELHMTAAMDGAAIDLSIVREMDIVFQGENGLSQKSGVEGNASYYYSIPRMETEGTITIQGEMFEVTGVTWMDHEFSTSALGDDALGWDWFGLIFDDGRELMIGQIRLTDGGKEPAFGGLLVDEDGTTTYLPADSFEMQPLDFWTSEQTGVTYPSGWDIQIRADAIGAEEPLEFQAIPLMKNQELPTDPTYWEGAVRVEGDVTGYGYNEMTGYADEMTGRF